MKIGILGNKNSDHEKVAKEICKLNNFKKVRFSKILSVKDLVSFVDEGFLDYGVLPINNSESGDIISSVEALSRGNVEIVYAKPFNCHNYLFTKDYVKMEDIKKIYCTEQAMMECSKFLEDVNREVIVVNDSFILARYLKENIFDDSSSIICEYDYGSKFDLFLKRKNIENQNSATTFVLIKKSEN